MKKEFSAYENFTVLSFWEDDYFQQWVRSPGEDTNLFWNQWLQQNPDKKEIVMEARQLLLDMKFKEDLPPEESFSRVWQRITAANEETDRQLGQPNQRPMYSFRPWQWAAAVASVLVAGAVAIWLVSSFRYQEYETTYGEVKNIVLPDGSQVKLNANSTLRIPTKWSANGQREVWLEGEAYFSVVHTRNHQQFLVHLTDSTQVEVLGTQFSVFQRDRGTRVVLTSGKVKLDIAQADGTREVMLKPGELVESMQQSPQFTKKAVDPVSYSSWTDRKLVFNNTPLPEVISVLQENYGLTITVSDTALLKKRVWGSAPMEDVDVVLAGLSKSFGWQFTRKGDAVLLEAIQTGQ